MSFKDAIVKCFKCFADFNGRARRSEYWYFLLFNILVEIVVVVLLMQMESNTSIINYIISIALLIPTLSVGARRMHDIGKGGGLTFLQMIPLAHLVFLLAFATKDSQPGANQYGPNPKGIDAGDSSQFAKNVDFSVPEQERRPNAVHISDRVNAGEQAVPEAPKAEAPSEEQLDEIEKYMKSKSQKKVCKVCGAELKADDAFCNNCGAKVE